MNKPMTVGEFKRWLREHKVSDSATLVAVTFDGTASVHDVDSVSLNGRAVQIELIPERCGRSIAPEIDQSVDNAIDNMKLGLKPDWE